MADAVAIDRREDVRESAVQTCRIDVTEVGSGRAVGGVLVKKGDSPLGTTDDFGAFAVPMVGGDRVVLRLSHPELVDREVTVRAGDEAVHAVMQRAHRLQVKAVEPSGAPLQGIAIALKGALPDGVIPQSAARTGGEEGTCVFDGLPAGDYWVVVDDQDWIPSGYSAVGARDLKHGVVKSDGEYRVPETLEVCITLERPTVACVRVEGDEVVRHWFEKPGSKNFLAPGVAASLRKMRAGILAKHSDALVAVWLPPEPVRAVILHVFLRHSGWHRFDVPTAKMSTEFVPHLISVQRTMTDHTGILSAEFAAGTSLPVVATLKDRVNGDVTVDLAGGEAIRVPLGQYSVEVSPAVRSLKGYLSFSPDVMTLDSQHRQSVVRVIARTPIRKVRCHVLFQKADREDPAPVRGGVEIYDGERLIDDCVLQGDGAPRDLWLPCTVPLVWRMNMLVDGAVRRFECQTTVDAMAEEAMRIILR